MKGRVVVLLLEVKGDKAGLERLTKEGAGGLPRPSDKGFGQCDLLGGSVGERREKVEEVADYGDVSLGGALI